MFRRALQLLWMVLASFILAEALLWTFFSLPDPYSVSMEKRFHQFLPNWNYWAFHRLKTEPPFDGSYPSGRLTGVDTTFGTYSVNRYGFLYPEDARKRAAEDEIRIAVIGGSTVECITLRPENRWPAVVEQMLERKLGNRPVTVLNLGISGQGTPSHLAVMAQHAVKLDLDVVVLMIGANELFRATEGWEPMLNDRSFRFKMAGISRQNVLWLVATRTQIGRRVVAIRRGGLFRDKRRGSKRSERPYFAKTALRRAALPTLPYEPQLSEAALNDYEANIISLAALGRAHGNKILLTNQPSLWKASPTKEERAVDWMSHYWHDGQEYRLEGVTSDRMLSAVNQRLMTTCDVHRIDCLDLAAEIPKTLEYFYDPLHFNDKGAEEVAKLVADKLLSTGFFDQSTLDRKRHFGQPNVKGQP